MEFVVSDKSSKAGGMPAQSSNEPSIAMCLKSPAVTLSAKAVTRARPMVRNPGIFMPFI